MLTVEQATDAFYSKKAFGKLKIPSYPYFLHLMHSKRCLQNSKMGTAVLVKVSIRQVGGSLGLSCGGKNFCGRADFEEF